MVDRTARGLVTLVLVLLASACGDRSNSTRQASQKTVEMEATAYCISGETRSGTQTRPGIVAADPRVLPLGSVIRVQGLSRYDGTYEVTDTGRAVKGRHIDIFIPNCTTAKRFGRQTARVRILNIPGDGEQ
jgi:3D (Asp-Asp-Asp) domain-containing protein